MNWPQPHEGIIGSDRDDDLLAIDDTALAHREVIRSLAHHLQTATLVGNPAPVVARMRERLSAPQVGDLVVESSTLYRTNPKSRLQGFGILIAERREWWETDEEWAVNVAENRQDDPDYDEERLTDHAWYVQYGSNKEAVCRWTNCSFLVAPVADTFTLDVGVRDDRGVTLTRDDLLGSLADSGFDLRTQAR